MKNWLKELALGTMMLGISVAASAQNLPNPWPYGPFQIDETVSPAKICVAHPGQWCSDLPTALVGTWDGTTYVPNIAGSSFLSKTNNLSDLASTTTARTNLGLVNQTPQSRLTLTSGTPVLTSNVVAATTIYYTPYLGNQSVIPTATGMTVVSVPEISAATGSLAFGTVYDLFLENSASPTLCIGPAWNVGGGSSLARGFGNGSSALTRNAYGYWVNQFAVTNCGGFAAGQGLYVGTLRTDSGAGAVTMNTGTAVNGGGQGAMELWNMFNRVPFKGRVTDTNSWTYPTAAWAPLDQNTNNSFYFINGMADAQPVEGMVSVTWTGTGSGAFSSLSIGFDLVNNPAGVSAYAATNSAFNSSQLSSYAEVSAGLGFHFICPIMFGDGTNSNNWTGGAREGFYVTWWG